MDKDTVGRQPSTSGVDWSHTSTDPAPPRTGPGQGLGQQTQILKREPAAQHPDLGLLVSGSEGMDFRCWRHPCSFGPLLWNLQETNAPLLRTWRP